jgi:hypothetical protein
MQQRATVRLLQILVDPDAACVEKVDKRCKLAGAEVQEKGDWSADASVLNKDVHMVT